MDENCEEQQLVPPAECTDNKCSFPTPLDDSNETPDYLKQLVQCWRQKHDKCVEQIKVLDNYNDQTRRLFCNENKTLKRELDEKDTLLSQETKKQDQLQNLKEKELADSKYELKQHIEHQEHKISDLEHHLQKAQSEIDKNSNLLKNAEERIKAYENQLVNSTQLTDYSAGVSTSEVQSGCRACVKITEELNALKLEYDEIIKDLELKNSQLTIENKSLHSKLLMRNQSMKQVHEQKETERSVASLIVECKELKQKNRQHEHTNNDLERCLKEAKCEIDEKLKHNTQLIEENDALQNELQIKKQNMDQVTENFNALRIQHDESVKDFKQMKCENVQMAEENNNLRSELDVRKGELKNVTQITNEMTALKCQLKETKHELDEKSSLLEHAESRLRMSQKQLMKISKFNSSAGVNISKIRNGRRVYVKKVKLGKKYLPRYHYRRRCLRVVHLHRVPCRNLRATSKRQYLTI